jgi:hypothetical protein
MFNLADRTRIEIKNDAAAIARWDDEGGASTPQTTNIPKDRDRRHSAPMIDGEDEADLAISTHIGAEAKDEY